MTSWTCHAISFPSGVVRIMVHTSLSLLALDSLKCAFFQVWRGLMASCRRTTSPNLRGGQFPLWGSYLMKSSARTLNILCSSASRSRLLFSIAIWILLAGLSSLIQVHLVLLWVVLQQGSAPVSVLLRCHFVKWVLNWVRLQCWLE
jgi:hypothetical protein